MNPEQSHKLVKQTFQADFDRQRFVEFIDKLLKRVNFNKTFVQSGTNIRRAFIDKVNSFERIGQYTDAAGKTIDILIVNLKKDLTLERGRTGLRNFAADYLQSDRGAGKSAVLIAYVSSTKTDWRFSYVTLEKDLRQDDSGRFREEVTKLTPARRYSFLVGKNENSHTAQRQFFELLSNPAPKLQNVENAFNIEKVTKEFFAEYKLLFEKVRNELDKLCKKNKAVRDEFISKGMCVYAKDEDGDERLDRNGNRIREPFTDDFAKKLLGQIVFLYFLQKKGWFGVERDSQWGTGDKNFLRTLFSANSASTNFFDSVLEPLFYNTLAVKREHDWSDRFNCKIPFLNGGLFEPLNNYDWVHVELQLLNSLFSNTETSPQGDKGTGILDVFDRYNFTINEAEPLEVEVAVDPEMLGKIFENLLPENIRHGSGTYYTPRVIVAYMCQQSLINYLANELTDVPRADLETFIRFGSIQRDYTEARTQTQADKFLPQTIIDNALLLDDELKRVTVCDPAVGSGAFPVGMMLEIVRAREALQSIGNIERLSQYELKRQTIENSLYGVDIDSGAVEIAKLRLWLSLIVDEAEFRTIEPLPNLDYKIMQGNSLLDEFQGVKLIDDKLFEGRLFDKKSRLREIDDEIAQLSKELGKSNVGKHSSLYLLTDRRIAELKKEKVSLSDGDHASFQSGLFVPIDYSNNKLEELKKKHKEIFDETRKDVKEHLREEAEKLEWEFIEAKLKADGRIEELAELIIHRRDKRKNYFLWQLNFPEVFEKGGFDVIIANPPYLREKGNAHIFETVNKSAFGRKFHQGKMDYWFYFLHKAIDISNPDAAISFITPRYWINSSGARKLISRIREYLDFRVIVDIGKLNVFENVAGQHLVAVYSKNRQPDSPILLKKLQNVLTDISEAVETENLQISTLSNSAVFTKENELRLDKESFEVNDAVPLGDVYEVSQGIVEAVDRISKKALENRPHSRFRPGKGVFVLSKDELEQLGLTTNETHLAIREYLEPTDIKRYCIEFNEDYVIYANQELKRQILKGTLPNLKRHLDSVSNYITSSNRPYGLHRPRESKFFDNPKIVFKGMFVKNEFAIDYGGRIAGMSFSLIIQKEKDYLLEYLLAILNSKFALHWFNKNAKHRGAGVDVGVLKLRTFPVKQVSIKEQRNFKVLVDKIHSMKSVDCQTDTEEIERELDEMVNRLYGV